MSIEQSPSIDASVASSIASQGQSNESSEPIKFPFLFAKRHGVLVDYRGEHCKIMHAPGLTLQIIAEIMRFLPEETPFEEIERADFDRLLAQAYQNDSSESMQMVEGMGDDLDLA
ncbi:MAG: type II secretion system protein GspE, partial [Gammaproteobacteria bacterium]|nr:type II secretion system protein GspE [Gammaproteobacteria bacterium]